MRTETIYTKEEFDRRWPTKVIETPSCKIELRRASSDIRDSSQSGDAYLGLMDLGVWRSYGRLDVFIDSRDIVKLNDAINALQAARDFLFSDDAK